MSQIWQALVVLLSHWRRRPGQLITLMLGLSLATGLWTGVQAINTEARSSYAAAEGVVRPDLFSTLEKRDGTPLSVGEFVQLRSAGWRISPVLEGAWRGPSGKVQVVGIEPLTTPLRFANDEERQASNAADLSFMSGEGQGLVNGETAAKLEGVDGLPPLVVARTVPRDTMIVDIGVAEQLLERVGQIDRLVVALDQPTSRKPLDSVLAGLVEREPADPAADVGRLTDSFHLNLTAFGFLSFAVGLFIVHATIGLAFEQRRGVFRTLRTLGVSSRNLTAALALELLVFALLAGGVGIVLGYAIAALLLPDVAATLRGLYGADVPGQLAFRPQWWVSGLAIALIGTFAAAAGSLWSILRLPVLASAQPRAWAMQAGRVARVQTGLALVLLLAAAMVLVLGSGLVAAFVTLGLFLIGCALLLPSVFAVLLRVGEALAWGPLVQWFWADTRQQVRGLSLALMALLLALAANIGVSTMVGSFRATFTGWLDQRLAAELYIRTEDVTQRDAVLDWLDGKVDAALPIQSVDALLVGQPGEIFAMVDHSTYRENWPLLTAAPDVWDNLAAGWVVLINEQLSRREGLRVGDTIDLPAHDRLPIGAIYSDYGNPSPQAIVGQSLFQAIAPEAIALQYALRLPPERIGAISDGLKAEFALQGDAVVDQAGIKSFSLNVFDRTFTVTDALNVLTLAVAGFAIFTSLLTLATMRLPQLAPVWALGLTRWQLARLELLRALMLAVLTALVALPVGLVLAWLLLAQVNVEAFGWRLPMVLFPFDYLRLGALALLAAVLAAAIPAWRLARTAPADLVKVFAHER